MIAGHLVHVARKSAVDKQLMRDVINVDVEISFVVALQGCKNGDGVR